MKHKIQSARPLGAAMATALLFTSVSWPNAHAQVQSQAQIPAGNTPSSPDRNTPVLKPVVVQSTGDHPADGINNGYQGLTTRVGKTDQALIDIPQSVTVIPQALMRDRAADNMVDALRNVAGITFNAGEGGRIGDNIVIRGYNAANDLFLDQFRDNAQYNRDIFNDEQIDVLRGSASMLFGRGSTGGVVNRVSKQARLQDFGRVDLTVGTEDYKRATMDINQQTGETSALRINAMVHDASNSRGVESDRKGIAPTFSWGIGTPDTITVSHFHLAYDNQPDFGIPWINARPAAIPVTRQYGALNGSFQRDSADITTLGWQHVFSAETRLNTGVRHSNVKRSLRGNTIRFASTDDNTQVTRGLQSRGGEDTSIAVQSDLQSAVAIGGLRNEIAAGVEWLKEDINRFSLTDSCTTAQRNTVLVDPMNTVGSPNTATAIPACYLDLSRTNPQAFQGYNLGLYVQDTLHLTDQWRLLAGLRRDSFRVDSPLDNQGALDLGVTSYRTGALFQHEPGWVSYFSYGTSFNPSTENYTIGNNAGIPPEKNRNIEIGSKWDAANGNLSLRAAIFRTEKTNERNTDLTSSTTVLSGRRHTDGIELEAAGRINSQWSLFASAAVFDAEIDEAAPGSNMSANVGKRPGNTPPYAVTFWSTWKPASRWTIGGGVEAVGNRTPQENYVNVAPRYARVDALVQYDIDRNLSLRINGNNLTNEKIYSGLYRGFVVPGATRQILASISWKY